MDRREERDFLDTVRWVSAGVVALGHGWTSLFARQDTVVSKILWALADTRHEWVMIFFVLSGYLVGGNALLRAESFDFKRYAIARFSRIYIVLVPALLLTLALDGSAHMMAPHSPIYTQDGWAEQVFGPPAPFLRYTLQSILASLLSVETVVAPAMGSDGPLWSLGFEWIFYFCFPALLLLADMIARRLRLPLWPLRGGMMLASIVLLIGLRKPYDAILWSIWVSGAAAHVVAEAGWWPRWARWFGAVVCVAGFVAAFHINYRYADALIGLGAASFLCRFPRGERGVNAGFDRALAGGSYSLYVIHMPILAFLSMIYNERGLLPAGGVALGWTGAGLFLGMAVVILAMVAVFQRLFEANTDRARAALYKRV